jgi:hypothetical protein
MHRLYGINLKSIPMLEWRGMDKVFSQPDATSICNLCPDEEKTMRASSLRDLVKYYRCWSSNS